MLTKSRPSAAQRFTAQGEIRDKRLDGSDFELREASDDEAFPVFTGHAAVFDSRTAIGNPLTWGFYEEIAPGAFKNTLAKGDARFLVDHETFALIGRVSAGNLRLKEDDIGLAVEADLNPRKTFARDLIENLRDGSLSGMSFGFRVVDDKWDRETVSTSDGQEAEVHVRRILEVELFEVSAVTFPAYEETDAALRAIRSAPAEMRFRVADHAGPAVIDHVDASGTNLADLVKNLTESLNAHRAAAGLPPIARAEPAETTRDDESQPAETTGVPLSVRRRRLAMLALDPTA